MWHNNKLVFTTYSSHHSQNSWANVEGLGWRKVKTGATDGVTNLYMMFNAAKGSGRRINCFVDTNNEITIAYLL